MQDVLWDYIFVGGGLSASVVANRLLRKDASLKVLVVEAGPNANQAEDIVFPNSTNLIGGDYDWKYKTVPQVHLHNRNVDLPCGKALGGGTVINSAGWSRGDKIDFDLWGRHACDARWSYDGLLPYMKMTEDFNNGKTNTPEHGGDGPIHIQSVLNTNREYPLRDTALESWKKLGVEALEGLDGNAGHPLGVADLCENRRQGRRQIASVEYPLDGATVMTNSTVAKILIQGDNGQSRNHLKATGIKLVNGTEVHGKEVILSAGAIRTPQLLMLSGIGPKDILAKHGLDTLHDAPHVGTNFMDHGLFISLWKVKNPKEGWSVGSDNPLFKLPQYSWGTPTDFIVSTGITDKEGLARAIEADEGVKPDPLEHPLLRQERTFNEHILQYAGAPDGSLVIMALITLLPTSRGSVTLKSSNIEDEPLIDPNYHSTEVDRFVAREGMRLQIKFAGSQETPLGWDILDGELGAPGFDEPFSPNSTDSYIEKRLAAGLGSTFHPMGTAAMGKVVDSSLRVIGVSNLRVVDTSVFPIAVTAHLQVATYAMALQAADIIYSQGF